MPNILQKGFIVFYLTLVAIDIIFGLNFSTSVIVASIFGVICAIVAHTEKYEKTAIFFLVLHMGLEWPHLLKHAQHHIDFMMIAHSLHVVGDFFLLYVFNKKPWKRFLGCVLSNQQWKRYWICIVSAAGISVFNTIFMTPLMNETKGFALCGIFPCIIIHFWKKKNKFQLSTR